MVEETMTKKIISKLANITLTDRISFLTNWVTLHVSPVAAVCSACCICVHRPHLLCACVSVTDRAG